MNRRGFFQIVSGAAAALFAPRFAAAQPITLSDACLMRNVDFDSAPIFAKGYERYSVAWQTYLESLGN